MTKRPAGMKAFLFVQIGQIISLLGSGMTMFAIAIWVFSESGRATDFSLLAVTGFAPIVLFSPLAGALVDRWDRKLVMMISDLAAGVTTIIVFILLATGKLEIWHLFVTNFFNGAFQAFQFPAYSAAITMMVPKEQYGRASGLMSLAGPASNIFAPLLAGSLIGLIGIEGIMIIDIVTFSAAIGMLLFVYIPQPEKTEEGEKAKGNLWQEMLFGFKYIFKRPSLLGLQMMFFYINLVATMAFILMTPMILTMVTVNGEENLAAVMTIGSLGGLAGGLVMSVWGGPKRRVHGVLLGMAGASLFSQVIMGLGAKLGGTTETVFIGLVGATFVWGFANFMGGFIIPILNGSNQALWQAKVAPELQGRVFAVRRWIAQITAPVGMAISGPLADRVFEPAMMEGGNLSATFSRFVGTGSGAGMSLIFFITGLFGVIGGLSGYLFPAVRNAEDILPDHDVDLDALIQHEAEEVLPELETVSSEAAD